MFLPEMMTLRIILIAVTLGWPFSWVVAGPKLPYRAPCGRSPLPQPGESFDQPIAPVMLRQAHAVLAHRPLWHNWIPQKPKSMPQTVPWGRAWRYVGRDITVEGRVVSVDVVPQACFLNFARDWRGLFYVVIINEPPADVTLPHQASPHNPTADPSNAHHEPVIFDPQPVDRFLNQTIHVHGIVRLRDGRPQIVVRDPSRITVLAQSMTP